jgi:hypothetical protein
VIVNGTKSPRPAGAPTSALGLLALLVAWSGCGERTFEAEEFVAEANGHDAGLVLGPPLSSSREDAELRTLSFAGTGAAPAPAAGDVHGGGSLTVLGDDEEALAEYERCESSVSLICFRAANVVLIFEGDLAPADLRRVERALRALASE